MHSHPLLGVTHFLGTGETTCTLYDTIIKSAAKHTALSLAW